MLCRQCFTGFFCIPPGDSPILALSCEAARPSACGVAEKTEIYLKHTTMARRAGIVTVGAGLVMLSITGTANAAETLRVNGATVEKADDNYGATVSVTYSCDPDSSHNILGVSGPNEDPHIRKAPLRLMCDSKSHTVDSYITSVDGLKVGESIRIYAKLAYSGVNAAPDELEVNKTVTVKKAP